MAPIRRSRLRLIAQRNRLTLHRRTQPLQKTEAFITNSRSEKLIPLGIPLLNGSQYITENIGIQGTRQTLIRRDQDTADFFGVIARGAGTDDGSPYWRLQGAK